MNAFFTVCVTALPSASAAVTRRDVSRPAAESGVVHVARNCPCPREAVEAAVHPLPSSRDTSTVALVTAGGATTPGTCPNLERPRYGRDMLLDEIREFLGH
ncbi:hypothetical protein [Streptomyces sp. NPDC095613]|uniref:hypothetical protein n=1 Tax=Streptomyces sp. NPDC095613 TaxID=3155540 RepID=UPI003322C9E5